MRWAHPKLVALPLVLVLWQTVYVWAGTYDYAGKNLYTGQRSNNWDSAESWTNGPGAFPNAPGDIARTTTFVAGEVDFYLNREIRIGTFNWSGTVLCLYGGTTNGRFIVDNAGQPSTWQLELTLWLWFDADITLSNDLRLIVTNSSGFGERVVPARLGGVITGPGKLILDCHTPYLNTFQLGIGWKTPNSYTGGTRLIGHPTSRVYFEAMKNGFFGAGDVELTESANLVLRNRFDTNDYIADTAALWLETINVTNRPRVYIDSGLNEKVARLYIDNVQMPAASYGSSESRAAEQLDEFFSGPGTLTVLEGPPNPGKIKNLPPINTNLSQILLGAELLVTGAAPTTVYIYWGRTDGGMHKECWENEVCLGTRELGQAYFPIDYVPGDTIFFRCYLSNALGGKWAAATAKVCPPIVQNELPLVRSNYVMLRGSVLTTGGPPTELTVYWGRTDGGTNNATWENATVLGVTTGGILWTNLTGLQPDTVYYYRVRGSNVAGVSWAAHSDAFKTVTTSAWGNITFVVASDLHYGATWHVPTADELCKRTIENINLTVGQPCTWIPPDGFVPPIRGVLLVGDLTEGRTLQQWQDFTNDWGLLGERILMFPVYEGFGNHDASAPYSVVPNSIKTRTVYRPCLRNVSSNGYHYSFDWDFLHVVCLNVFPGNGIDPGYSLPDPSNSLPFLESDLSKFVGPSGRPVVIYHHYGFDSYGLSAWSERQRNEYFKVITNYNVVCIFSGHSHTINFGNWRGISTCIDGTAGKFTGNFVVAHLTRTNLVLLERTPQNKWGQSFTKPIIVPQNLAVSNGDGPTDVTTNSAQLNGIFLMNGPPPVDIYVFWGRTDGETNRAAWENVICLGPIQLGPFSTIVTGLCHGTTYYYRCLASNSVEQAWAPTSAQFITLTPNSAPALAPVPDQFVEAGATLLVTNIATDPESPPQRLTFRLLNGPEGASLMPDTGLFSWRAPISAIGTTNSVVITVTDDGSPSLGATQRFNVIVLAPARPLITDLGVANGAFEMKIWCGLAKEHLVEYSTNLFDWITLLTTNGPLLPLFWAETNLIDQPMRFYRVRCVH